jgi:hypothetical protein
VSWYSYQDYQEGKLRVKEAGLTAFQQLCLDQMDDFTRDLLDKKDAFFMVEIEDTMSGHHMRNVFFDTKVNAEAFVYWFNWLTPLESYHAYVSEPELVRDVIPVELVSYCRKLAGGENPYG